MISAKYNIMVWCLLPQKRSTANGRIPGCFILFLSVLIRKPQTAGLRARAKLTADYCQTDTANVYTLRSWNVFYRLAAATQPRSPVTPHSRGQHVTVAPQLITRPTCSSPNHGHDCRTLESVIFGDKYAEKIVRFAYKPLQLRPSNPIPPTKHVHAEV